MTHYLPTWTISFIPALPLLGFIINSLIGLTAARKKCAVPEWLPATIACALPLSAFVIVVLNFLSLLHGHGEATLSSGILFNWMSTSLLNVNFAFMMDPLSGMMALVVTGVGTLIHFYSIGYMKGDEGYTRYFSYLNLFLFFMLLLILGDNLLLLFIGWEGVGLCSYLLIGFWFTDAHKAFCGKKAFVVNRIGDFGFLIGIFLIIFAFVSQSQSTDLNFLNFAFMQEHKDIFAPFAVAITLCLFMGATGKSAQIPLYVWLPDAMAGPTPVSALIHAATMVTAGVYMVARMYFLYAMAPLTLHVVAIVGLATAIVSALIAITQFDIKKVLAYSTVSQLGFMFIGLGVGAPHAAIFHVITHAFFKACLFMGAGSVIVALHHEQDIRNMGGLWKKVPATAIAFLISCIAIAGIPPFAGFFSKDEILWNTYLHAPFPFYILAVIAAGLTAFYMFRLFVFTFLGEYRGHHGVHAVPAVMNVPVLILAGLAVVGGAIGIPEVFGVSNFIHHFLGYLNPVAQTHAVDHSLELQAMGMSTLWALMMSGLGFYLYKRNLDWAKQLSVKLKPVYEFLLNKFYVDEIYNTLIIRPIHKISEIFLWQFSDKKVVDGVLVHGWTDAASFSARLVSRVQSGVMGHYLVLIWVGLIVLLVFMVK
jgi:NADH-quinone oxidoreductase subunit L